MTKIAFDVTESMRQVTAYEVDTDDLTPELVELVERLGEAGDLGDEAGDLADRLVAAAGGWMMGEVLATYPADEADHLLSYVGRGS